MKEVLIYGALVAAVMAASVSMIGGFVGASKGQAGQINTEINNQGIALVGEITKAAAPIEQ